MDRHELDPISLVFGVVYTALGLLFLAARPVSAEVLRWALPLLAVGLGAAIAVMARRGTRSDRLLEPSTAEGEQASDQR